MSILYRVKFTIGTAATHATTFKKATQSIQKWAKSLGSPEVPKTACHNDQTAWGLKVLQCDASRPKVQLITEIVLHQRGKDEPWVFGLTIRAAQTLGRLTAIPLRIQPPEIVKTLATTIKCADDQGVLTPKLHKVTQANWKSSFDRVEDAKRTRPILFIAATHDECPSFMSHPRSLAYELLGLVDVWQTTESNIKKWNGLRFFHPEYEDGGAQIFWPADENGDINFGPAWSWLEIAELEANKDFGAEVAKQLLDCAGAGLAVIPDWSTLTQIELEASVRQAIQTQGDKELLALFDKDNLEQQAKISELEKIVKDLKKENSELRSEVYFSKKGEPQPTTREQTSPKKTDLEIFDQINVKSVKDAIELAEKDWPDKLIFKFNRRSDGKKSVFSRPKEVFFAFKWLAEKLHPSKMGVRQTTTALGSTKFTGILSKWECVLHTGDKIVSHYPDYYHTSVDGVQFSLDEHLKSGGDFNPMNCIRIGLAWHPTEKKIIVGYLGQHPKNQRS